MGGFYGSIQVRSSDRAAVRAAVELVARQRSIRCLVGPELNGWVGIYPEGHGQDDSVGREIAEQLDADVLHLLVHDDDVLAYWLWRDRRLVDSYWSKPGYFGEENRAEEEARRGDAEKFRGIVGDKVEKLAALLERESSPAFEYERLEKFAKLLDISNAVSSYEYLKDGERDGIKGWRSFEEIPSEAVESLAQQKRAERNRVKSERAALRKSGLLLFSKSEKEHTVRACRARDGFVCAWPTHRGSPYIEECPPPFTAVNPSSLESPAHVTAAVSNRDATRIAFAAGDRVRVWDATGEGWEHLLDIPEKDLTIGAAISSDGSLIAHASRQEIVVTEVARGRRLFSLPPRDQRQMAFHPVARWLAVAGSPLGLISIEDEPRQREICIGGKSSLAARIAPLLQRKLQNIDVGDLEKKHKAALEVTISKFQSMGGNSKAFVFSQEQIDNMREEAQKAFEQMRTKLATMKAGDVSAIQGTAERGNENVMCVGFSRDGRWLYCGTNLGLRVYDWDTFPTQSGAAPPTPVWQYDPPSGGAQHFHGQINGIVEEADGSGIVFGGWAGKLWRLRFDTGEVRHLVSIPGGGGVYSLAMSRDGKALAVCSHFSRSLKRGALLPDGFTFEVWSYARLRDAAVKL